MPEIEGLIVPSNHQVYSAVVRQVEGLKAERAALRLQVAALADERNALREQVAGLVAERDQLRLALEQIAGRAHTMQGTPMGSQRQERNIWTWMGQQADTALGR